MLMEKRMYIALIFVAAFLCSYAQQSDKSTYLAHIRQADSLYMAGDPAGDDTRALLRAAWRAWLPARVIALAPAGADDAAPAVARGKTPGPDGRARAYLCAGGMCRAPVDTADALAEQLRALAAPVEE